MNVWGTNERSWRKARKRAVSPIIATILLVAITVVLAAVLYVLISGLTKGPGNTPIGTALAAGSANLEQSATASTGCAANHYCYELTVESAGGGITPAGLNLQVRTSSGGIAAAGAVAGGFYVLNINGASVVTCPVATTVAMTCTSWTAGTAGTSSTALSSTMTIWVDLGTTTVNPAGTGLSLAILGVGSYSGTETIPLP
jgi:flagellin-like protein